MPPNKDTVGIPGLVVGQAANETQTVQYPIDSGAARFYENAQTSIVKIEASQPGSKQGNDGSGFFVSTDGLVATDYHEVEGFSKFTMRTSNGVVYNANLVGEDRKNDLALLKIHAAGQTFQPVAIDLIQSRCK